MKYSISRIHYIYISFRKFNSRQGNSFPPPDLIILTSWNILFEKIEEEKEASNNASRTYAYTDGR